MLIPDFQDLTRTREGVSMHSMQVAIGDTDVLKTFADVMIDGDVQEAYIRYFGCMAKPELAKLPLLDLGIETLRQCHQLKSITVELPERSKNSCEENVLPEYSHTELKSDEQANRIRKFQTTEITESDHNRTRLIPSSCMHLHMLFLRRHHCFVLFI